MIADFFTKPLQSALFTEFRDMIMKIAPGNQVTKMTQITGVCWNMCLQMILADHGRWSMERNIGCVLKAKTERAKSYVRTKRIETVKSRTD
jgi:hypothetical protein